jgi:hypothetical protein
MVEWTAETAAPRVNPADLPYSAPLESRLVIELEAVTSGGTASPDAASP